MGSAQIKSSEWLPNGVIVHFTDDHTVFYSSQYLWDHKSEQQAIPDVDQETED